MRGEVPLRDPAGGPASLGTILSPLFPSPAQPGGSPLLGHPPIFGSAAARSSRAAAGWTPRWPSRCCPAAPPTAS